VNLKGSSAVVVEIRVEGDGLVVGQCRRLPTLVLHVRRDSSSTASEGTCTSNVTSSGSWPRTAIVLVVNDVWMAVGLGNPGERYARTRHNAGSRAAARLAQSLGVRMRTWKGPALVGEGRHGDTRLVVATPTTYMNDSGRAVAALKRWFKVPPERIVVLHDEIDLPAGALRLKLGGGSAGNHGIDSVVEHLGTKDFHRVRIGVGRPASPRQDPADWVLEVMSAGAAEELAEMESRAADSVLELVDSGLERAMNRFNTR
jgi:PTH1 family peptidyl-tRNA hydrolase